MQNASVTRRYLLYPDRTAKRCSEGGLRLQGRRKEIAPAAPLVTVVTTVRDRALVVESAICSVLAQTYPSIEYVVVDGASTDGTLEVIEKYDDRLDYYVSEPDSGLYEGMNKGLALAHGDYIVVLNSDDWYHPRCIEVLVDAVRSHDLDVACALATETDIFGNITHKISPRPLNDAVRLRMPLRHETMLVSRNLYEKVGGYDASYQIIADLKFTQLAWERGAKVDQLNEYLMFFRANGRASLASDELIRERCRLLREQFSFLDRKDTVLLANEYSGALAQYVDLARKHCSHRRFVNALRYFLAMHGAFANSSGAVAARFFESYPKAPSSPYSC